jgi:hypothetical protein
MKKLLSTKRILIKTAKKVAAEAQRLSGAEVSYTETPRLALEQWLFSLKGIDLSIDKGEILISALRNNTWIEWAIYAACVFRKLGYQPNILYRASEVNRLYSNPVGHFNFWKGAIEIPWLKFIDIESVPKDESVYNEFINKPDTYYAAAIAYDFHIEADDILKNLDQYAADFKKLKKQTAESSSVLSKIFKEKKYYRFILYSGLIGESQGPLAIANRNHQEVVCVEGWSWRAGHMIYNYGAPALEYNLNGWIKSLGAWDDVKDKEINSYLKFLDGEKVNEPGWLDNFYLVQRSKISEGFTPDLAEFLNGDAPIALCAPNVIGDSSLLNRETIFSGLQNWLEELIEYFRQNPDKKLIIRAHPAEVWVQNKLVIKIGDVAQRFAEGLPNVFILDGFHKVNTFALLPYVKVGLVWISSVGVDMVLRGIPVITAANPKYAGMGIVEEPGTKKDYYDMITRFLENQIRPDAQQVQRAKEFQYIVFKGFSFQAQGTTYRAMTCKVDKMPRQKEHDRFFGILSGEEEAPDKI